MDYIKREDALKWCRPEEWGTPDERWRQESEFGEMIKALPAADVVERKKGKWIARPAYKGAGWGVFFCSVCDNPVWWATDFCHNCGADMRGGEDE